MKRTEPALRLAGLWLAACVLAGSVHAQVPGRVTTVEGKIIEGGVRWKAVAKKYSVVTKATNPGAPEIEIELAPSLIAKVEVQTPRELQAAVEAVRSGKASAPVMAALDKIAVDYTMLQWDEVAARWLAEAHLANKTPAEAVKVCERVVANRPEAAYAGEMAVPYWRALLANGRTARLEEFLDAAVKSGNREASANALIMRGDALMEKKQPREALKNGYLRVVVLYEAVRSAQPEALYKAALAFDALQQVPNAEKLRQKLRTDYAASEYARKL